MNHNTNNVSIKRWRTEAVDEIYQMYNLIANKRVDADFRRMVMGRAQSKGVDDSHFLSEFNGRIVGFMISY